MVSLLDVNVLVALLWDDHESHERVRHWFTANAPQGWATCPFTEAAFVRITSNPAFSPDAVSPQDAIDVLEDLTSSPGHQFWKDDLTYKQALSTFGGRILGHQQVTDAYLLGLAIHRKGKLVTLDHSIVGMLGADEVGRAHLDLLRGRS